MKLSTSLSSPILRPLWLICLFLITHRFFFALSKLRPAQNTEYNKKRKCFGIFSNKNFFENIFVKKCLDFPLLLYLIFIRQKMTKYENINDKSNQKTCDMGVLIYFFTHKLVMQKTKSSVLTFIKPEMGHKFRPKLKK